MEFVEVSRFKPVEQAVFPPFSFLRQVSPVVLTMDLELWKDENNLEHFHQLVKEGFCIMPVKRMSQNTLYSGRKDFPLRVLFEMTSICNARCQMCPQINLSRKKVHMDKDKYLEIIEELDSYGVEGLWLYHFGESLLHPYFKEIVKCLETKKNLGYIWLSTNGILANEEIIDFLLLSSLSYLNFSLQSISVENYKKIAPTSPADRIFENLKYLIEKKKMRLGMKPFFRLQIIEQEHTTGEIDAFLRRYAGCCDLISVNMLEHTHLTFNKKGMHLREHRQTAGCNKINRGDCFVNSDGSVAVCDNAYNNEMDIGNIWESSLFKIWNGPLRQEILKKNANGSIFQESICSVCTDYDL